MSITINSLLASSGMFSPLSPQGARSSVNAVQAIDISALYSGSSVQARLQPSANERKTFTTSYVQAPWTYSKDGKNNSLAQKANLIMAKKSIVDPKAKTVLAAKSDTDLKTDFTVFNALQKLQTLADYASQSSTNQILIDRINKAFTKGMSDLQDFMATAESNKLNLVFGDLQSRAETISLPTPPSAAEGLSLKVKSAGDVLSSVTTSDLFEIKLTQATTLNGERVITRQHNFTIDPATITGPITANAIVNAINQQIESVYLLDSNGDPRFDSNGDPISAFNTRATTTTDGDGYIHLAFNTISTEEISIKDPNAPPSLALIMSKQDESDMGFSRYRRLDNIAGTISHSSDTDIAGIDQNTTDLKQAAFDHDPKNKGRVLTDPLTGERTVYRPSPPGDVLAETSVSQVAVDKDGNVYTVGSSAGDIDHLSSEGRTNMVITKSDSAGNFMWKKLIGEGDVTTGYAITTDLDGNVIVAGSTDGELDGVSAWSGRTNGFVTKLDSSGSEIFTEQFSTNGTNAVRAVTTDDQGRIYVAGNISGKIKSTETDFGGQDIFIAQIDPEKKAIESQSQVVTLDQVGTSGTDKIGGLAIDSAGQLVVASTMDGQAQVRTFNADTLVMQSQVDLGDVGTGGISGVAVDESTGNIIVAGTTRASLGTAVEVGSYSGSGDNGFVTVVGSDLQVQRTTYMGSGKDDIASIASYNGKVYVAGSSGDGLTGVQLASRDAFVARLDEATGAVETIVDQTVRNEESYGVSLGLIEKGNGILGKFGLTSGIINPHHDVSIENSTRAEAGDHFYISVNGGSKRRVSLQEGDTFQTLAYRISRISPLHISAEGFSGHGSSMTIKARLFNSAISITKGDGDKDLLSKIGLVQQMLLHPNKLYGLDRSGKSLPQNEQHPGGSYALDLDLSLALLDRKTAQYTKTKIDGAIKVVQAAYNNLYWDPIKAEHLNKSMIGKAPAYLTKQIASYQEALRRLGG